MRTGRDLSPFATRGKRCSGISGIDSSPAYRVAIPPGPPDKPRPAVFGLLVLGGAGLALIAIAVFAPVVLDPISSWTQLRGARARRAPGEDER